MKRFIITALSLLFLLFILASCVVQNKAIIQSNGAGTVEFDIKLEDYFFDAILEMSDLASGNEALPEGEIFNVPQIEGDFRDNPAITVRTLETPKPWILRGEFTFDDIEAVFEQEKELQTAKIVQFSQKGNTKTISVYVDQQNFSQVSTLFPLLDDPFFSMFGPVENAEVSREEYIEMIEFAFGEEGAKGVLNSTITLIVRVEGTIVSQSGGKVEGNNVIFTIPLLQALRLDKPLDYTIVFR